VRECELGLMFTPGESQAYQTNSGHKVKEKVNAEWKKRKAQSEYSNTVVQNMGNTRLVKVYTSGLD